MLRLFAASLLIVSTLSHSNPEIEKPRKSLGFAPVLPHAIFDTNPTLQKSLVFSKDTCPFKVAKSFVIELTGRLENDFVIRKDSYTDSNTRVTHVYVRQLLNGLEVADGDINVNVKDGTVMSYGNSFYKGPTPPLFTSPADGIAHIHAEYCAQLLDNLRGDQKLDDEQVVMSARIVQPLEHLYQSQCEYVDIPYTMHSRSVKPSDFDSHNALLQFMIAATPKVSVAHDILANYDLYLSNMTSEFTTHFVGTHKIQAEIIHNVPDSVNPVKAKLAYVQVQHGSETMLNLVWKFEVEMEDNWYEAAISATSPHRIVSVIDWASDSAMAPIPPPHNKEATYKVYKLGINDPSVGTRSWQKENYDVLASPVGWHSLPWSNDPSNPGFPGPAWRNTTTTWGNNVFAQENWAGGNIYISNKRPDAGKNKVFDYKYNPKPTTNKPDALAEAKKYINASVTQLFYVSNLVHDLYYRYGFDEVSGNFQQYNFGRGGEQNDAVIAHAQDGSGMNNANFMTPPDGQNGKCRMYLWDASNPYRDGDFDTGIVIHELSHGLSTRLTGGPANSGCLGRGESGGMGEGWGDFLATTIRSNRVYSDYPIGAWAANRTSGIRKFNYSIDHNVNPSTYKILDKPEYSSSVHAIGEVWAEMLWNVNYKLIEKHGYGGSLFPPAVMENGTIPTGGFYRTPELDPRTRRWKPLVPKHGNTLMIQLVIYGMKLQKCTPSFFNARDAIIQADTALTGGENVCDIWEGFAERGLGPNAKLVGNTPAGGGVRTNDYEVPAECN